jgi:hypothetical protein
MKKVLLAFFCAIVFIACENYEDDLSSSELKKSELGSNKEDGMKKVTVPFKADFLGDYVLIDPGNVECAEDGFVVKVGVDFEGTATHLGKFTGSFEFCAGGPDDPDIEGPDRQYGPTISHMEAANGDILYVSCWGSRAEDHPEHVVSYWRDPFIIIGGTGRFEGATGSGYTDDFNSTLDNNSHHHWKGTITLIKTE